MNKTKYSLLVYMLVSFLKNSVKIRNVQKILWVVHRTDNHTLRSFFSPPWIPGGTFESYGDTGQVFITWACPAYCRAPGVPGTLLQTLVSPPRNSRKSASGTVSALLRTVLNCHGKAFQRACIVLLTLSILRGSFLGQIEGSVSPGMTELIYHCIPRG